GLPPRFCSFSGSSDVSPELAFEDRPASRSLRFPTTASLSPASTARLRLASRRFDEWTRRRNTFLLSVQRVSGTLFPSESYATAGSYIEHPAPLALRRPAGGQNQ